MNGRASDILLNLPYRSNLLCIEDFLDIKYYYLPQIHINLTNI